MQQFRPSRFEILPTGIKNIIIICGLVFLAQNVFKNSYPVNDLFALHTLQSPLFEPWQIVSHLFMHADFGHLLFNMLALWMFGSVLENLWGLKRFLIFYFACGLGAAFAHLGVLYFENHKLIELYNNGIAPLQIVHDALSVPTLGASGAVFGCLFAFGYLFPNTYIYFYFLIPIKAKYFVLIYAFLELTLAIQNSAGDTVAHVAHLGGGVVGFLLVWFWNKNNRKTFY